MGKEGLFPPAETFFLLHSLVLSLLREDRAFTYISRL